jgi:hypothetical protein
MAYLLRPVIAAGDIEFHDPSLVGRGGIVGFGLTDGVGCAPRNEWLLILKSGRVIHEPAPTKRPIGEFQPENGAGLTARRRLSSCRDPTNHI